MERVNKRVSVDLGYGWTKAIGPNIKWKQPSVIGERRNLFEDSLKPNDIIFDNKYFVGDLAIRQSTIRYTSTKEQKSDLWTTEVLLKTALGIIAPKDDVFLITGLPIDFYFSQKADFEKMIYKLNSSKQYLITIGGENIVASPYINRVKIVPQPLGSAMDYLLDEKGNFVNKEDELKDMKSYIKPYTIEEALEIKRHWAINHIRANGDYYTFITKMLPPPSDRLPTFNNENIAARDSKRFGRYYQEVELDILERERILLRG